MHSNILIPLDGSETAEAAVDEALELVPAAESVHLIVVDATAFHMRQFEGYTLYVDQYREIRKQAGLDYVGPFKEKLEAAGVKVSASVVFGDPVPSIARVAKERESDLILLGGSGGGWFERHTGLARFARRLARQVGATVLTVLPREKAAKEKLAKAA